MNNRPKLIPCPEHVDSEKLCGLCGGSGLMRLQNLTNTDGSTWEIYVPNSLTEKEAQDEYQRSMDMLCNKYKLTS